MRKFIKLFLSLLLTMNLYGCNGQEKLKASDVFDLLPTTDYLEIVLDSETICVYKVTELNEEDALLKELIEWFNKLEIKPMVYEESPAFTCTGGLTYTISTKDHRSFAYSNACGDYLIINDEWYEITNPTPFPSEGEIKQIK